MSIPSQTAGKPSRGLLIGVLAVLVIVAGLCVITSLGRHGGRFSAQPGGYTPRVGIISSGNGALGGAEGWALHTGLLRRELRKAGIVDVQFVKFPNGPDLNEALAGGALDVGLLGDTPALIARGAGLPTRAINQDQVGMNVWLIAREDGPKTVADLRGKTVATSKGSYMSRYLLGLLQEQGLSHDVTFVHLLPSDAEPALRRGDIAAYAAPAGTGPLLVAHGFKVIDQAVKHPGLTGSHVTVVTERFLAAHPDFPQAWNHARRDALADLQAHPAQFYQYEALASHLPLPIAEASFPLTLFRPEPFTRDGLALLDGTKTFLHAQGLLKTDFRLNDWTTASPIHTAPIHTASARPASPNGTL